VVCWLAAGLDELSLSAPLCAGSGHSGRYGFNANDQLSSGGFSIKKARSRMGYHIMVTVSLFSMSPF